jgi:hypothetical protein
MGPTWDKRKNHRTGDSRTEGWEENSGHGYMKVGFEFKRQRFYLADPCRQMNRQKARMPILEKGWQTPKA